jgi:hypothetical protein
MFKEKNGSDEHLNACSIAFTKAYRESLFLFGEESDVYKLLTNFQQKLGQLVEIDKKLNSTQDVDCREAYSKVREPLVSFITDDNNLKTLEKSLQQWLDFHEIK